MASPLKKSVDLAAPAVRVSRIRRDPPPPPPKKVSARELRERDGRNIVIGILLFALAMFFVLIGINSWTGQPVSHHVYTQHENV